MAQAVDNPPGTAVVTGATGGLGSAFARGLAARGYDLLLADVDGAALESLAGELRSRVRVETFVADLTRDEGRRRLADRVGAVDGLALLVNNAGYGTYSMFAESDLERELGMVGVHVLAAMALCRAALPGMVARGSGGIINVASAGAFLRFPRDATYIGTKSFLVAFTECLAIELVGSGVAVEALCPAWVRTGFSASGDYARVGYHSPIPGWLFTSPEVVVESSLRALGHGRVAHVPVLRARIAVRLLGSRLGLSALAFLRRRRRRPA